MRELPEPVDPDDKLFDHIDKLLIAIGDDALPLVTGLLGAMRTFRLQALITAILAALLTISLVPIFLSGSLNYFTIVVYVIFLLVTGWFAVRTLMMYASYSTRCARILEASKNFRGAKAEVAA
jgi:hypothetical protein